MLQRTLGRSGIAVSVLGIGTNTIGGMYWDISNREGKPVGYGQTDDAESLRGLRKALEMGVSFFDTADEYGCGRSEMLLGEAIRGFREQVVIATKFGYTFDKRKKLVTGINFSPAYIRKACTESLHRLQTDFIDIYLLHLKDLALNEAARVRDTLEDLVDEGMIRYYGWSTDDLERARFFAEGPHCTVIEHRFNILLDNQPILALLNELNLGSINRIPLLMGLLTGKFRTENQLQEEDARSEWFRTSRFEEDLEKVEAIRSILISDGRTLAQASLAWIWTRSNIAVPVPGFRTVKQVEENIAAIDLPLLTQEQMDAIETLLNRPKLPVSGNQILN